MPDEKTYGFNADDATALLQSIDTGETTYAEIKPRSGKLEFVVILDADLPAATHALTGGATALATVCRWDVATQDYVETGEQVTVWNHSEATSHVEDTFGYARLIDGHYHFFGDCHPMNAR
jgi:hypothetical protein